MPLSKIHSKGKELDGVQLKGIMHKLLLMGETFMSTTLLMIREMLRNHVLPLRCTKEVLLRFGELIPNKK
jgi:hypothetical protein